MESWWVKGRTVTTRGWFGATGWSIDQAIVYADTGSEAEKIFKRHFINAKVDEIRPFQAGVIPGWMTVLTPAELGSGRLATSKSHDPYDLSNVPSEAVTRALELFEVARRNMMLCGDSDVVAGWWVESHTLGCRKAADEPEEDWWSSHWAILEEYERTEFARIMFDEDTGAFVTMTPQRKSGEGVKRLGKYERKQIA